MKPHYYSSIVNKQIYHSLTKPARRTTLHPNTLTGINIFIDFIFILSLFFYNKGSIPKSAFLPLLICIIIAHTFLDFFDGHVARTQNKTSKLGARLDNIADALFYIPYVFYMLYVALYLKKATNVFIIGIIVFIGTIAMLAARFNSISVAFEYFGLYFEVHESKIPLQYHNTEAPITDFVLLVLLLYVVPVYIIMSK